MVSGACWSYAELSTCLGAWRHILLHCESSGAETHAVGRPCGCVAPFLRRRASGQAVRHHRDRDFARSLALRMAIAAGRRRSCDALATYQNSLCQTGAVRRTSFASASYQGRTRHLATPLLGASDPRRTRLTEPYRLHPLQSRETPLRFAGTRLAAFVVPPVCSGRRFAYRLERGIDRQEKLTSRRVKTRPTGRIVRWYPCGRCAGAPLRDARRSGVRRNNR